MPLHGNDSERSGNGNKGKVHSYGEHLPGERGSQEEREHREKSIEPFLPSLPSGLNGGSLSGKVRAKGTREGT